MNWKKIKPINIWYYNNNKYIKKQIMPIKLKLGGEIFNVDEKFAKVS